MSSPGMKIGLSLVGFALLTAVAVAQTTEPSVRTAAQSDAKHNPVICIKTEYGEITAELSADRAPITVANFLHYISEKKVRNPTFYRVVRPDNQPDNPVKIEVLQGGLTDVADRDLPNIKHETTKMTGILHKDGVLSMARNAPGTATHHFSICIGDQPALDFEGQRNPDGQGFAAFGKVTKGMDVVKKIHQQPAEGQYLRPRVKMLEVSLVEPDQIAATPPLGWNSYDSYGALVTEAQFRANVDYMAAHLKPHGYDYAVLDYCWSYPYRETGRTGSEGLNQRFNADDQTFTPRLAMDDYGRLIPDRSRFPSAYDAEGKFIGLKPLVDYVHGKGLKFGMHIMRGIPRQAVAANSPVFGAEATAAQIADTESKTSWLNHMYGLKTSDGQPTSALTDGGQAYYNSIVKMYAEWGVDFIKADDMLRDFAKPNNSYYAGEIEGVRKAIELCGRPMVLSLSPGAAPLAKADSLSSSANMWRMLNDMWDNWREVNLVFDVARNWTPHRRAGRWPDADMLPLGTFVRPPVGRPRNSRLTPAEQQTVMTLWSIAKSPLMIGGDLPSLANDPATLALLTNDAVLAVDQHSVKNRQISLTAENAVWAASPPDSADVFVALFNRSGSAANVSVSFTDLGLRDGTYAVKDLWTGKDIGEFTGKFEQPLESHASGLYRIAVKNAP